MARLALRFGCGSYDRIEPLVNGAVTAAGIDLTTITFDDPRALFDQLVDGAAVDMAEMSLAEYITMISEARSPFVGIPVFTSRVFRHSFICVGAGSGIATPHDLAGRRIGVPLYSMSAAIWCRGLLRDDYGVDLSDVTWVEGAIDRPGPHGVPKPRRLHRPARIEANDPGASLTQALEAGTIDATLGALMPTSFGQSSNIARLFPDFRRIERDYFTRTRVHPIMHLVVVRREIVDQAPWMLAALCAAFVEAKQLALRRMRYTGAPKTMLPFLHAEVEETTALFGSDPWPDGTASNRPTLEKMLAYMRDDGLIDRIPSLTELFAYDITSAPD